MGPQKSSRARRISSFQSTRRIRALAVEKASEIRERRFLDFIREMRRSPGAQAEYHLPALKKSFDALVSYIPPRLVEIVEKKVSASEGGLPLHLFRNTFLLSPIVFKQAATLAGVIEDARAFQYAGMSVIKTDSAHLPPVIIRPIIHEWTHILDRELGIERSTASREGISYGLDLFISWVSRPYNVKDMSIANAPSREYYKGYALGKRIAIAATEIKAKKGDSAVQQFFGTLLTNPNTNVAFINALKRELLI